MPLSRERKTSRIQANVGARRMRALERALARLATKDAPEDIMRRRAEIVLAQVAAISIGVLIANDRGRYIDVNAAATILTGYTRAELLRMTVWDLTPTPRQKLGLRLWRDFIRRGRMRGHYQIRRKDGALVSARYIAVANVLPGLHVSALTTPELIAELASGALSGRALSKRRTGAAGGRAHGELARKSRQSR